MKHVRLPIYDGDQELNEHLEVSVEILQRLAKTSVVYKDHVKVVQGLTDEQEMDLIDRIMCGLPTQKERMASAHYRVEGDKVTQLVKPEEVEWKAEDIDFNTVAIHVDNWRPIPGFSMYEMSKYQMIAEAATGKSVSMVKGGRIDNVLLTNDDGITKRMSVPFLFSKTFPEY